jgi:asparagine N-glycosylation enzyme membrane subunit Stt3
MLESFSLLIVGAPWPLAIWLAYSLGRRKGPVHGFTFGALLLALLAAIYVAGYRTAAELTDGNKLTEATFALATMTLQAYGLLVVAMAVRSWLGTRNPLNN